MSGHNPLHEPDIDEPDMLSDDSESNRELSETDHVLYEVRQERTRQDAKWGQQDHTPAFWLMVLGEEVGEANKAALEEYVRGHEVKTEIETHRSEAIAAGQKKYKMLAAPGQLMDYDDYRKELVQVAAVAVSAIEALDRGVFRDLHQSKKEALL